MALTKYRLGTLLEPLSERCNNPHLTAHEISGINADKEFFEPAKQVGTDTSNYKIVPPNYFACNLMHVGRDKVLPIALNCSQKSKVVSPAYFVFKIVDDMPLLCNYFFIMLKSAERDRYFWFHTDASVRDGMSWDDFCDLEIELPDKTIQQKYVDVYNSMLANQRNYERGLDDLKLTVDTIIEKFKHKTQRVFLGDLVEESDIRNENGEITNVHGVNKDKLFMPSVTNGADLTKYKIVRKGQFACNLMHVGRDVAVPVALQDSDKLLIVSPAYLVFSIKSRDVLPEYLLTWLSRAETDRYAWFMCDTNVRSGMEKKRFYEIDIPVPTRTEQESLIEIYVALSLRREINEQLKTQIRDICPILIKGSLEEGNRIGG